MRTRGGSAVSLEGDRVPLAHAASSRPPPLLLSCARLAGWICCWYTISISLTLYNKWFFDIYDFHYPLLVTSLHIAIKVPSPSYVMDAPQSAREFGIVQRVVVS